MMIRKTLVAALMASLFLLPACEQIQGWMGSDKAASQSSQTANTTDQKEIATAQQHAYTAPIGQTVSWNNTDTSDSGTITAIKDGYSPAGAYCRQFQHTLTTGSSPQTKTYSTACQQPDGSWKIVQ